jgi:hypothetical protein
MEDGGWQRPERCQGNNIFVQMLDSDGVQCKGRAWRAAAFKAPCKNNFRTGGVIQTLSKGMRCQKNGVRKMRVPRFALKGGAGCFIFLTRIFLPSSSRKIGIRFCANPKLQISQFVGGIPMESGPVPPGHWPGGRSNATLGKGDGSRLQAVTPGCGRRVADRHRRVACATHY